MSTINNLKPAKVMEDVINCKNWCEKQGGHMNLDHRDKYKQILKLYRAFMYASPGTTISLSVDDAYLIKGILNTIAEEELNDN